MTNIGSTITKEESVLLLYEAIDKIHRGAGAKGEWIMESAVTRLFTVINSYLYPAMVAQSGQGHADAIIKAQKVRVPDLTDFSKIGVLWGVDLSHTPSITVVHE